MQWSDMLHALSGRLCYGLTTGKCQWIRMQKKKWAHGQVILPDVVWHVFSEVRGGYNKVRKGWGGGGGGGVGGLLSPHKPSAADTGNVLLKKIKLFALFIIRYALLRPVVKHLDSYDGANSTHLTLRVVLK